MTAPDKRFVSKRKPHVCPACKGKRIAPILYGEPAFTPELEAALRAGTIALGGCCLSGDDPVWKCADCGSEIYRS